jgi:hypothetical protein
VVSFAVKSIAAQKAGVLTAPETWAAPTSILHKLGSNLRPAVVNVANVSTGVVATVKLSLLWLDALGSGPAGRDGWRKARRAYQIKSGQRNLGSKD